jgi:hypothetical protein
VSKVEELREQILNDWYYENKDDRYEQIDSLIAAAREEGAGQERVRIVRGSQRFSQGDDVADSDYISTDYATAVDFAAVADCELFVIPASILAPVTKELRKGLTKEEYDNLFKGTTSDDPSSVFAPTEPEVKP